VFERRKEKIMRKISSKIKRKLRNRKKLRKVNNNRYRISVSKSLNNFFTQIIDDKNRKTLVSASSIEKEIKKNKTKKIEIPSIPNDKFKFDEGIHAKSQTN
jgi:large subunit ribosomal protein L18